jgi:chemotaxis protein CheX
MNTTPPQIIGEIGELLKSAVIDVFSTMFSINAKPIEATEIRGNGETLVAGSVGFVGNVNGVVYVYLRAPFARKLTGQMLGIPDEEVDENEMVGDAIGELSNMIVGSTKSRLCDSGASCKLTIPSIVRGQNLNIGSVHSSQSLLMSMDCNGETIMIELIMQPST